MTAYRGLVVAGLAAVAYLAVRAVARIVLLHRAADRRGVGPA